MIIAIDFDGTCVTHEFPRIGKDIGAVPVLKALVKAGHKLILNTMRDDSEKFGHHYLSDAVEWFEKNGIELWGVNENPTQSEWTESPKAYAHCYIDDMALGCPMTVDLRLSSRPFVDWKKIEQIFKDNGVFDNVSIDESEIL